MEGTFMTSVFFLLFWMGHEKIHCVWKNLNVPIDTSYKRNCPRRYSTLFSLGKFFLLFDTFALTNCVLTDAILVLNVDPGGKSKGLITFFPWYFFLLFGLFMSCFRFQKLYFSKLTKSVLFITRLSLSSAIVSFFSLLCLLIFIVFARIWSKIENTSPLVCIWFFFYLYKDKQFQSSFFSCGDFFTQKRFLAIKKVCVFFS